MSALPVVVALTRLTPITLTELNAIAPLQARRDRKYLVPTADLDGDADAAEECEPECAAELGASLADS